MAVSIFWPLRVPCKFVCMCICVYVILNQSTRKKPHVSDLGKLDILLHKKQQGPSGTKVSRFDICRSTMLLSSASNVAESLIQPKKQDNEKGSGDGF